MLGGNVNFISNTSTNMWVEMPKAAGASSTLSLSFRTQSTVAYHHYTVLSKAQSTPKEVKPSLFYIKLS